MRHIRERLAEQTPLLGLNVNYGAPAIIEMTGGAWDWIWIDQQHGQIEDHEARMLVMACELVDTAAVVRVPSNEAGAINRAMDTDCAGVIVPQVDTPEQALRAVQAAKFPPLGDRSYGGRRVIDRGKHVYSATANLDRLLILQIESPTAIENADAIASMEGVDALFLGPDDLRLRRGEMPSDPFNFETFEPDFQAVADACRAHGKIAVTVAMNEDMLIALKEMGYGMLVGASDVSMLRNTAGTIVAACRTALEQSGQQGTKGT